MSIYADKQHQNNNLFQQNNNQHKSPQQLAEEKKQAKLNLIRRQEEQDKALANTKVREFSGMKAMRERVEKQKQKELEEKKKKEATQKTINFSSLGNDVIINSNHYKDEIKKAFASKDIKRAIKLAEKAISDPKPDDGEYTNEMYKGEEYAATYKPHSSNFNNLTVLDNDGNTIFRIYQHVEFPEIEIPANQAKDRSYLEQLFKEIFDNIGDWIGLDLSGNARITQAGGIHFYATGGQGDPRVISESAVEHIDVTDLLIARTYSHNFQVGTRAIKNITEFTSTVSSIVSESESAKKEVLSLGEKSTDKSSKGWVKATFNNEDGTSFTIELKTYDLH